MTSKNTQELRASQQQNQDKRLVIFRNDYNGTYSVLSERSCNGDLVVYDRGDEFEVDQSDDWLFPDVPEVYARRMQRQRFIAKGQISSTPPDHKKMLEAVSDLSAVGEAAKEFSGTLSPNQLKYLAERALEIQRSRVY